MPYERVGGESRLEVSTKVYIEQPPKQAEVNIEHLL